MKIKTYLYSDSKDKGWTFSEVEFRKLNLLVGNTGAGKTRFLNTVFNLGVNVARTSVTSSGYWTLCLDHEGATYEWEVEIEKIEPDGARVKRELLCQRTEEGVVEMVSRDQETTAFFGDDLPKLTRDSVSLNLFKDDERIKPLYDGFSSIMRRNFSSNELEEHVKYQLAFSEEGIDDLAEFFRKNLSVNWKLYYLSEHFPERYQIITDQYLDVFPFISRIDIKDLHEVRPNMRTAGQVPVLCIKENHMDEWIPSGDLSSGMQKVLMILTDVNSLPDGGIYLIDEYENSLGVNAINFFPSLLSQVDVDAQFIVTSHHPYIINNIPAEDWLIFHREGQQVKIRYGEENAKIYGRSKQQRFIQLINDPFYIEGVE